MTGYVRNDTSNSIANDNVIDADDLDGEFDAIVSAFNETSGHTHDGTPAEGAPITVTGPAQEYVSDGSALYPKTDNSYDLGKTGAEWKDLYVDGVANIDSLVADTADINGGTLDGVVIGGSTPAAGSFTDVNVTGTVDGRDVATDGTKLDGIETGATADQSNAEIKTAYEANADTNAFTDADKVKLDGVEASADVTDTANVTAAGALMDSEVDADIKTLSLPANTTISAYGATLVDDANATAARTTLGLSIGADVQAYDANLPTWPATVDATEVSYLNGVTSAIQTQFDNISQPPELTQVQVEDDTSTVFGQVSGQRLSQANSAGLSDLAAGAVGSPRILGRALAGPTDVPTLSVTAADTVVRAGSAALGLGYVEGTTSTTGSTYVVGATFTVSQAYTGSLRFYATQTSRYTGGGSGSSTSRMYLRKNGVTISSVFTLSSGAGTADRSFDSAVASGDVFEWMHSNSSGIGYSRISSVEIGGSDLYVAAIPMIKASESPF